MTNKQRSCLAAALIASMIYLAAFAAFGSVLLDSMISHFQLTSASKGFTATASSVGGVLALIGSLFVLGKVPKMRLLWIVVGVCSVGLALLRIAPSYMIFVGVWVVLGVCTSMIDSLTSACMANLYKGRDATRMMSMMHMLYSLACVIYPVVFNAMISGGVVWNDIYLFSGLLGLALFGFIAYAMKFSRDNGAEAVVAEKKVGLGELVKILGKGVLPGMMLVMFCNGFYMGGMGWINRYISTTLNSDLGGVAISFVFFGVMVSRLLTAVWPVSPAKYVRVGGLLAGAIMLCAIPFKNGTVMCGAVCLCGLCYGAMIPCIVNMGTAALPQNTLLATTALGLSNYVAQGIASPLLGAIESAFTLHAGIALCGVFMILTSLTAMFVPINKNNG